MTLKIGHIELKTNLLLAPMAGYCDLAFRLIPRSLGGVGLASTDLLCSHAVVRETRKTLALAATCEQDSPLCIQLFGCWDDPLPEAARWAEDHGYSIIDVNMGCPSRNITKQDGGSRLLCDPDATIRMIEKVRACLRHTPLTAKLRLGWDDSKIVAPYLARRLEEAGVAAITIHGRTTEMKFSGEVRLDGIAEVVAAVKTIPVFGNGDVRVPEDARRMIEKTGCAGVMIGRAALSAPWIFRDAHSYLTTGTIPPEPTIQEKCHYMHQHFENAVKYRGERSAVLEFRRRASWYAKQMQPCRMLKDSMLAINSAADFDDALRRFLDWRQKHDEEHGVARPPGASSGPQSASAAAT